MSAEQFCTERVIVRGAVYLCGRVRGHDAPGSTSKDPHRHECIGFEHPADGVSYMLAWYGPTLLEG